MIVGIGVDLCAIDRWQEMSQRRPGLVTKLLTDAEADHRPSGQAARFAAKEALAKALGAPGGLAWHDAEVVVDDHGRPAFHLRGTVAARAAELDVSHIHLSLTHDGGVSVAMVVCESS